MSFLVCIQRWISACALVLCSLFAATGCAASGADADTKPLSSPAAANQQLLTLRDVQPWVDAWPAITVLREEDEPRLVGTGASANASGVASAEQAVAAFARFAPPTQATGTLGLQRQAVWLRIPLQVDAASDGRWIVNLDYHAISQIDVYVVTAGTAVLQAQLGNMALFAARPLLSRSFAVPLELQPGARVDVLLRVRAATAMIVPLSLSKASAFHAHASAEQMLQGVLLGVVLCLLAYSLAQWVNLRDSLYGKFALQLVGSGVFSLMQFGIGFQYFWTDHFWLERHIGGCAVLVAVAGNFLFVEHVLRGTGRHKAFAPLCKAGAALMLALAVAYALQLISIRALAIIMTTLGMAPALLSIPGAIALLRRGDSVGAYFLVSWVVYMLGSWVAIGVGLGKVPANFWSLHAFQAGTIIDLLMFMRVLGIRSHAIQLAATRAKAELLRMHTLAHTDPLTNLMNRRGLNRELAQALAKRSGTAVYLLDLDNFKPVNDQFGHDVGDELLRAIADRLTATVRRHDVVARLGGDEFVVMMQGLDATSAQALGEQLLSAFQTPFELATQRCSVGVTIGYALSPEDGASAESVVKAADQALYLGKQRGKNCVVRAL